MERGVINLHHCVLCEDTSLLLKEATDGQRSMATRDRDSWLMTTSKFTELQGKLNRTPTVMELLVEVTSNMVAVARGQVKEEPPSMESVATAQGDGEEFAPAASDAEDPAPAATAKGDQRLQIAVMLRSDVFREVRARKINSTPGPAELFQVVNYTVAQHLADVPVALPDLTEVLAEVARTDFVSGRL